MTKAELQRNIEAMVSRRTNQSALTYIEKLIVSDAINAALVDISTQVGFDQLKPRLEDTTASLTASTNYVDLDDEVISIVDGTVRIEAKDTYLTKISLADFYALDPGENSTGIPTMYTLSYSDTTPRLMVRDTPDSAYTVALTVKKISDENSVSDLPGWMHGLLSSRSICLAFEDLGLDYRMHEQRYKERLQNVRNTTRGHMGPQHIRRIHHINPIRDIESYKKT